MSRVSSVKPMPLIVIVGETASGKSSLAQRIARDFGGEIINADSRMIYIGMDIGTAKPSKKEREEVKHHLLDIVKPDQAFSVSDYQALAKQSIDEVRNRSNIPILVGGSGLYVDSVIYDYKFRAGQGLYNRQDLNDLSLEEINARLQNDGLIVPESLRNNKRFLIRALETGKLDDKRDRSHIIGNTIVIGLRLPRDELRKSIMARVENMFRRGLVHEVRDLVDKYGWDNEALTAIGYREFAPYFRGEISKNTLKKTIVKDTIKFAKRQRTWFKRNRQINWFNDADSAYDFLTGQFGTI